MNDFSVYAALFFSILLRSAHIWLSFLCLAVSCSLSVVLIILGVLVITSNPKGAGYE